MAVKLKLHQSAVLVWLPEGETPTVDSFNPASVQHPPSPNPEPWWLLEEAIVYVREADRTHDKVPWIKAGDEILDESAIRQAYTGIRAMRAFDAPRS